MTTLRFTRDQFIEALEARRPWAEERDEKFRAEHEAAEKQWLKDFRGRCRELAKKSYRELKEEQSGRWRSDWDFPSMPSCPRSTVAELDRFLVVVRASRQQTFTVNSGGLWDRALWLLTHDDEIKEDLCA